jgi:hypothetical protein
VPGPDTEAVDNGPALFCIRRACAVPAAQPPRAEARRYRERDHRLERAIGRHVAESRFEQAARAKVVLDDRGQVEAHVAGVVELTHLAVGAEQQLAARAQAAFGAQLAEIADALRRAVDPRLEFEAAARGNDARRLAAAREHELVIVARDAGRVERVRLALQRHANIAGQRILTQQPPQPGLRCFGGCGECQVR